MFSSSKNNIQILNHINKLENKIDILINTKNGCNCHERETKIYQDLQCFFEHKFEHMKNDILDNIPKDNNNNNNVNLLEQIIQIIKDTHQKNKEELTTILSDICKKQNENKNNTSCGGVLTETQLRENITGLFTSLVTNHAKFDERLRNKIDELNINIKHNDTALRTGLQDIIISIKNDIITSVNSHQNNEQNDKQNDNLDNFIKHMTEQVNSINDRVDGFYFENETIKHQLLLEEEIRGYNDDIDQIKLLINNVKSTIETALEINGFEHLKAKYHNL